MKYRQIKIINYIGSLTTVWSSDVCY